MNPLLKANPVLKRILEAVQHYDTLEAEEQEEISMLAEALLEELNQPVLGPHEGVRIQLTAVFHKLGTQPGIRTGNTDAVINLQDWESANASQKTHILWQTFNNCMGEILTHVKTFISQ